MQAVVFAGGRGTRMLPLTENCPKSLLRVAGRPFIDWQLERLVSCGFDDIVLCVSHLAEQIQDHVGDGAKYGARVRYSRDNGMGQDRALLEAYPLLRRHFLVTYGDSYLAEFDYALPMHVLREHEDCSAVMAVCPPHVIPESPMPNVATSKGWVLWYRRHWHPALTYVDYGAIARSRETYDASLYDVAEAGQMRALEVDEPYYEVGSPEGLARLEAVLR